MKKRFIPLIVLCMVISGLLAACGETKEKHQISITEPTGVVYPYHDFVKSYLMTENANMLAFFVEGTEDLGD